MINPKKISYMTKLAIYDNYNKYKKTRANDYHRYDYISKNNLANIIFVSIITTFWTIFFEFESLVKNDFNVNNSLFTLFCIIALKVLSVVLIYTFIGIVIYNNEYDREINNSIKSDNNLKDIIKIQINENNNKRG